MRGTIESAGRDEPVATPGAAAAWYRREPWVAAVLAAFALLVAAMFLPRPARLALVVLAGAVFLGAVVLLVRRKERGPP